MGDQTHNKIDCPRCGGTRTVCARTLICSCSAEFTSQGYALWRALPTHQALRTIRS